MRKFSEKISGKGLEAPGITPLQVQALDYIKGNPGTPVRGLSENLFISSSAISQLTDRLFALKLICRKSDSSDRRSVLVSLTKKGEKDLKKFKKKQIKDINFVTKYMSADDIEQMIKIHKNVLKKIEENKK
ncbi:MAG: MarR family winged helix-turn-helix transcriptional regulator [Candidatus Moranbacteria bacterium]|nr:MarR family winged helix-turn-helix transcriptional regulator [Candidatus Moranbacteria bacterium]